MEIKEILDIIGNKSKNSQKEIAFASHEKRKKILKLCSDKIKSNIENIIEINKEDLDNAFKGDLKESYIDRLRLDENRILDIVKSLNEISQLPDPLQRKLDEWERPNGLKISRKPTPLGVLGIIFDSFLSYSGLYVINSSFMFGFIPIWLVVLWISFSTLFVDILIFLKKRRFISFLAGFLLVPPTYYVGIALNIAKSNNLFLTILTMAIFWGTLLYIYSITPNKK